MLEFVLMFRTSGVGWSMRPKPDELRVNWPPEDFPPGWSVGSPSPDGHLGWAPCSVGEGPARRRCPVLTAATQPLPPAKGTPIPSGS